MFVDYRFQANKMETKRISFTTKGYRLKYIVEASSNVHVFIVDNKGWESFNKGKQFNWKNKKYYGEYIEEEVRLPYMGEWNLLIVNGTEEVIGFNFEVYNLKD